MLRFSKINGQYNTIENINESRKSITVLREGNNRINKEVTYLSRNENFLVHWIALLPK